MKEGLFHVREVRYDLSPDIQFDLDSEKMEEGRSFTGQVLGIKKLHNFEEHYSIYFMSGVPQSCASLVLGTNSVAGQCQGHTEKKVHNW